MVSGSDGFMSINGRYMALVFGFNECPCSLAIFALKHSILGNFIISYFTKNSKSRSLAVLSEILRL